MIFLLEWNKEENGYILFIPGCIEPQHFSLAQAWAQLKKIIYDWVRTEPTSETPLFSGPELSSASISH